MSAKRIYDLFMGVVLLIIAAPVMLFIALIIPLVSKGPVLFRAERAGRNFQRFTMYKFRTMVINHDQVEQITIRDDPRIYPFGRFLRKTKLDELPQIFNVLKGDMSIVGPRPEDYAQALRLFTGPYQALMRVEPGLTSPASLFDYTHGELAASVDEYVNLYLYEKMDMDLFYIQNQTFWGDMKIIARTVWVILCISFGRKRFRYPMEYRCK